MKEKNTALLFKNKLRDVVILFCYIIEKYKPRENCAVALSSKF